MTFSRLAAVLFVSTGAAVPAAFAQDRSPYRDDRSDGAAVIESFYNAINRKEYARAWGYYAEEKPAASLEAFTDGYGSTESVEVVTGPISEEGAAGSTFYNIPVAIRATEADGSQKLFAGCYVARLANPQIQAGDPFEPLHLVRGTLHPAQEPLEEALPSQCGDAPPVPQKDAILGEAAQRFATSFGALCTGLPGGGEPPAPDSYTIPYRPSDAASDSPMQEARLLRFYCGAGAYNETHVYYLWTEPAGLGELQFATPELDIRYQDDDTDAAVDDISVIGYYADDRLVNSSFTQEDLTIASHAKWRGPGDASSSGLWLFRNGRFSLVRYEVDASYDGAVNPETVLDYYSAP